MRKRQTGLSKIGILAIIIVVVGSLLYWVAGREIKQAATLKSMEVVGNIAVRNMHDDVAGGFHKIPIEVKTLSDGIYQATGIANTHMIATSEGNVLFDSGIAIQAAKQLRLLKEKSDAPVTHIILSHSHADHIGGAKFWLQEPTKIITHREFSEEQRYLKALEPYQWRRNRTLFPWMPESPPSNAMVAYGGIEPDILVTEADYHFTQGGVEFQVLATPGAEGADNICLWLPQKKMLFSGDFFGPLFPQFPNVFTMRGEKIRKPMEYIQSLNKLIALAPEMIVPSHHSPIEGRENIQAALTKMRDAVAYVHDETVRGMNEGKTVYELMDTIKLPEALALTEEHGKVSWAVKSIWEYYMGWFHFDSTTELYSVPAREVYAELAAMAGDENLLSAAQQHFDAKRYEKALHLLEVILAKSPQHSSALSIRLAVLEAMLVRAKGDDGSNNYGGNNYEKDYLRSRIAVTKQQLGIDDNE